MPRKGVLVLNSDGASINFTKNWVILQVPGIFAVIPVILLDFLFYYQCMLFSLLGGN
jgi:hypothetical protein